MESINPTYPTLKLGEENSKSFGVFGGCTISESIDNTITSNLAYDKYMALLAYGTKDGHIKMFSLNGYEQEVYHAHDNVSVLFCQFVPGQLLLFSIDAKNRLAIRDLKRSFQAEEVKKNEENITEMMDNISESTTVKSQFKAHRKDKNTKIF